MSWPSTDFECEIQEELDKLRAFKEACNEWLKRPEDSRLVVINKINDMAKGWVETASTKEPIDDAKTIKVLLQVLKHIEKG